MHDDFQADIDAIDSITAVPQILNVVCHVTGMGFAAVARVTPDRWVCLAVNDEIAFGLKPGGELKVETTICHEVRQARDAVVIDHVAEDEAYCGHHTTAMYGFQSYISMPIFLKDGSFYGTLCAIDPKPAKVKNPGVIGMFRLFADMIGASIDVARRAAMAEAGRRDADRRLAVSEAERRASDRRLARATASLVASDQQLASIEASLLDAHATSELREQFIAVLGHDLRNPLASVTSGLRLLERTVPATEKTKSIMLLMHQSAARMVALIDNVLDFARGRLGGGLTLSRSYAPLEPVLRQVVQELESVYPDRVVHVEIDLTVPVLADGIRIGQLLSNLLGNALTYGAPAEPVYMQASTDGMFRVVVRNAGAVIPPGTLERLFHPFVRGGARPDQEGLGLGLYIAAEIARAHGGEIAVTSSAEETRFTFTMPLEASLAS